MDTNSVTLIQGLPTDNDSITKPHHMACEGAQLNLRIPPAIAPLEVEEAIRVIGAVRGCAEPTNSRNARNPWITRGPKNPRNHRGHRNAGPQGSLRHQGN